MKNNNLRRLKGPVWVTVLVVAIIAFLVGAFFIFRYFTAQDELIAPTVAPTDAGISTPDETAAPTEPPTEPPTINTFGYKMATYGDLKKLDFKKLNDINPDIYAWIYIPDTNVDYPVAQDSRGDDTFYLSHNIYREYQFSGTIFSQSMNKTDLTDPVTVLYGHNMLNGSMFATLHYFEDEDFFNKHTTCFVVTKDKLYTYLIYAAYVYDDRHIMNSFNFKDEKVLLDFFDSTLNPRSYEQIVRENVELTKDSRILTLSTCTNGSSNTRYLVQGVLVNEQSRE